MKLSSKSYQLKATLMKKGYSITHLAKSTGYNISYVNQIINGKRYPSPKTASIIAKELEMEIEDLFEIYEKEEV
ncbi:helix-turn-helix transcriptional regulator [Mammaliicoccus sp. H-M34]|uniref:helix-turn-helix transcriptional regulator n=1 Tax=Mammaliicoccus sp. H-M34 TaxID=2898693 RepID=UPI001EFA7138|nr:helix-turn-helix transcriptional regulator [Mammaliicoccus sp. H-M34]